LICANLRIHWKHWINFRLPFS